LKLRVTAQDVTNRNPQDENTPEPVGVTYGRNSKIAEIQMEAINFVNEFLLDFEFPSVPFLRVGNISGFENLEVTLYDTVATIVVNATIASRSGQFIRLDLAVPLVRGELQRPTVAYYNDKPYIFSQDFLDQIVGSKETVIPKIQKPFTPAQHVFHEERAQRPVFSAPEDPTDWSLLLSERY
jgi:hypothetical protein